MTDSLINNNNSSIANEELLYNLLRECAMSENVDDNDTIINDVSDQELLCDYFKMIAITDTTSLASTENFNDSNYYSAYFNVNTSSSNNNRNSSNNSDNSSNNSNDGRISLAYENLKFIPKKIAEKFATQTKFLDLSYNNFNNISFLSYFKGLHTLILDRNTNLEESTFPYLPKLEILWMNNCNLTNIPKWIYTIQTNCPIIKTLSIMGNPGAKTLYNGASANEHNEFRNFIAKTLPTLIHLDDEPIIRIKNINLNNDIQLTHNNNLSVTKTYNNPELFSSNSLRSSLITTTTTTNTTNTPNTPKQGRKRRKTIKSLENTTEKSSNSDNNDKNASKNVVYRNINYNSLKTRNRKFRNSNYLSSSTN